MTKVAKSGRARRGLKLVLDKQMQHENTQNNQNNLLRVYPKHMSAAAPMANTTVSPPAVVDEKLLVGRPFRHGRLSEAGVQQLPV
jgi:hypothetical protein